MNLDAGLNKYAVNRSLVNKWVLTTDLLTIIHGNIIRMISRIASSDSNHEVPQEPKQERFGRDINM
jgi:hypothetical protein